uniref:Uncharacterized protein n=1 Tax=Pseudomonas aeruginosa TaxID=287 RepID=A0A7S5YE97_PSEAI|nr:hypothetical protein [Pseudomonas aeruginosa]
MSTSESEASRAFTAAGAHIEMTTPLSNGRIHRFPKPCKCPRPECAAGLRVNRIDA